MKVVSAFLACLALGASYWLFRPLSEAKRGSAKDMYLPGPASPHLSAISVGFHGVEAGPEDGELVLMLHGFPDNHWTFSAQMRYLSQRGYRCVAPAMPGYDPHSAAKAKDLSVTALARHALRWMDRLGAKQAHLVGHDWGAAVAQRVAQLQPDRVATLTIMAVPTAHRIREQLAAYPKQLGYSWYMFFFQLPWLPEYWLLNCNGIERLWQDWGPKYSPERLDSVKHTLGMPGVAKATVNYYRQNVLQGLTRPPPSEPITAPTLGIYGLADGCIMGEVFYAAMHDADFPGGLKLSGVAGGGHFMHHEVPAIVNVALEQHISGVQVEGVINPAALYPASAGAEGAEGVGR